MSSKNTQFKNQTLARLIQTTIQLNDKENANNIRITLNTVKLVNEYLRIFTTECILRSNDHRLNERAENSDVEFESKLDVDDLQAIAGLLVLDFS